MKMFLMIVGVIALGILFYFLMPGYAYVSRDGCVHGKMAVSFDFKEVCNDK